MKNKTLTFLLASSIISSSFANPEVPEPAVPPLCEVAQQVRKQAEAEKQSILFQNLTNKWKENLYTPVQEKDFEPVEYICRNLLIVFGIQADSSLSDYAVRQLRRKLVSEAESGGKFYANEIELKIEQPTLIEHNKTNGAVREVTEIKYNYISGFGLDFSPAKNVNITAKLRGSVDPLKLEAEPIIKTEIRVGNYLEIYGEIGREINKDGLQPEKYEMGINLDVLNLLDYLRKKEN